MSVVLVTGGARRLGKQIAQTLAHEKWNIAIHYSLSEKDAQETVDELRILGVQAHAFRANLSSEEECRALLPQVVEQMGSIKAVVNNASIFEDDSSQTFTYARLMCHMQINTAPAIILAQALHKHIIAQSKTEQGVVVNMLDQKLWNLNPDHLSYTLSKAALKTATEMLARELAPYVRVVGVAPGLTLPTPAMVDSQQFATLHQKSPLGQSSTPEEVAQAVFFAINNRALTGTSLVVDGGQHLMHLPRDISKLQSP